MSISELIRKIISGADAKLIAKAFEFAKEAHQGQKRASGEDYIQHPIRVAQILKKMRLDSQTIAAGFLHDLPDDTKKTLEDIEKEFGKEVAFRVEGVSKLGKLHYSKEDLEVKSAAERLKKPIDLKAENLRKMFFAMAQDLRVILIKLADRLHNMETLGSLPPEKRKRIALETLEIFAPLANRLGMGAMKGKLEDLAFPYIYPREFEWLMENFKERYGEREKYLEKVKPVLKKILREGRIRPIDIHSRAKHHWSLYEKLLSHEMDFDKIYDLVALRVIVNDVKDCYKTLGIIHKSWKPLPGRIKDYIALPKPNGYQALHTTLFCLDGKITEIQVKTKKMHEEAEHGIAAHWATKEGIDLKTQRRKFAWVAQLNDWQKGIVNPKEYFEGLKIDFFKNRIFVFTPMGDVIDLPEGATPVDFAYAVHTEIGNRCSGAKINGKIATLSGTLKNGDVVEIIIDKKRRPSQDWLNFVKTNLAKSRIREELKKDLSPQEKRPSSKVRPKAPPDKPIAKGADSKPAAPRSIKTGVSLAGETGMKIYLAQCCKPQTGQEIKAYITQNKGASVHEINCQNLIRIQKKWPQKIIEATWYQQKSR
jgi:GTP pyrophosphokinase